MTYSASLKSMAAGAVLAVAAAALPASISHAEDQTIATVNGQKVTETDMKLAEVEIGSDLGNLPPATKRRVLVEYLIENILFAEAAEGKKLESGPAFDQRMRYWRRRALRDMYFDTAIKGSVTEAEAKKSFEEQMKAMPPREEVHARHILVKTIEEAKDVSEKLARGDDFAALAKAHSKDPGSKDRGGDLGFFSKGQMVPAFEKATFALKKGEVSEPVKSQFGYHIIKLDDRRSKPAPAFDQVKERLMMSMMHKKAQKAAADLRSAAKIEYVDPAIKKMVEAQAARGSGAAAPGAAAPATAAPAEKK